MKKHETLAIQNFKFDEQKYSKTMVAKLHMQHTRAVINIYNISKFQGVPQSCYKFMVSGRQKISMVYFSGVWLQQIKEKSKCAKRHKYYAHIMKDSWKATL